MQNLESKSNYELRGIITDSDSSESLKNSAWELLKEKSPTNSELTYIIRWCSSESLKNSAWELLKEKSPTNSELTYIIEYCSSESLKNSTWELLKEKSPTNSELTYIIECCSSESLKNSAWELLKEKLGITEDIDQEALITEIANEVLSRPGSLKMNNWHCGTSHCIAGWACVINPVGMRVEKEHSTQIAGSALLPKYAHMFYVEDDVALEFLKTKATVTIQ